MNEAVLLQGWLGPALNPPCFGGSVHSLHTTWFGCGPLSKILGVEVLVGGLGLGPASRAGPSQPPAS
jgi:hypothetical protein